MIRKLCWPVLAVEGMPREADKVKAVEMEEKLVDAVKRYEYFIA